MATERWSYKWHYLAAIGTLISCECGYDEFYKAIEKKVTDEGVGKLKDIFISDVPAGATSANDPELIKIMRETIKHDLDQFWMV